MNLSKKARAVAIPSLEIDQPDCKRVAHSSSVGPIDETQLFYLETRGITPEDARKFIVLGFLEPVVGPGAAGCGPGCAAGPSRGEVGRRSRGSRPPNRCGRSGGLTRRVDLVGVDEIPPGTMQMVQVDGSDPVLVINLAGEFRLRGICSHEYFELDKGFLTAGSITCALHLSRFDLASGDALDPPAELPLVRYPVVVEDGRVVIEVPEGPLPVNG